MKPGIKTSELWLVVGLSAGALVLSLMGYSSDEVRQYGEISIARIRGAIIEWLPLVLAVTYVLQRGAVKITAIWARVKSGETAPLEELEALRTRLRELEEQKTAA